MTDTLCDPIIETAAPRRRARQERGYGCASLGYLATGTLQGQPAAVTFPLDSPVVAVVKRRESGNDRTQVAGFDDALHPVVEAVLLGLAAETGVEGGDFSVTLTAPSPCFSRRNLDDAAAVAVLDAAAKLFDVPVPAHRIHALASAAIGRPSTSAAGGPAVHVAGQIAAVADVARWPLVVLYGPEGDRAGTPDKPITLPPSGPLSSADFSEWLTDTVGVEAIGLGGRLARAAGAAGATLVGSGSTFVALPAAARGLRDIPKVVAALSPELPTGWRLGVARNAKARGPQPTTLGASAT